MDGKYHLFRRVLDVGGAIVERRQLNFIQPYFATHIAEWKTHQIKNLYIFCLSQGTENNIYYIYMQWPDASPFCALEWHRTVNGMRALLARSILPKRYTIFVTCATEKHPKAADAPPWRRAACAVMPWANDGMEMLKCMHMYDCVSTARVHHYYYYLSFTTGCRS